MNDLVKEAGRFRSGGVGVFFYEDIPNVGWQLTFFFLGFVK